MSISGWRLRPFYQDSEEADQLRRNGLTGLFSVNTGSFSGEYGLDWKQEYTPYSMTKQHICDRATINVVQGIVNDLFKDRVIQVEQWRYDALKQEFWGQAAEMTHAARELELMRSQVFLILSELFWDSSSGLRNVERVEQPANVVELPEIPARSKTLTVVSSHLID